MLGKRPRTTITTWKGPLTPGGFRRGADWRASMVRKTTVSRPRVIPGRTRTGGYFGRYKGPNKELKFFDTSLSFNVDATGEVPATGQLTLIPQGDTESTRDGRMAYVKSIHIKGIARLEPGASANAATVASVIVVLDTQCNGAAAAATDVYSTTNFPVSAFRNLANSARFKILKTFKMTFNSQAGVTTAYNQLTRTFEWYSKCNYPINYSSTAGAITEIRSNNIFLLAGTDGATDDLVVVGGNCRLRFFD